MFFFNSNWQSGKNWKQNDRHFLRPKSIFLSTEFESPFSLICYPIWIQTHFFYNICLAVHKRRHFNWATSYKGIWFNKGQVSPCYCSHYTWFSKQPRMRIFFKFFPISWHWIGRSQNNSMCIWDLWSKHEHKNVVAALLHW